MSEIDQGRLPIDIVGRSCRLPGARDVDAFWQLLLEQRCSVTEMRPERFSMLRYQNPRRGEKGKAYTFAAGVLDESDVWGFDAAVFGISPREAAQMDPQQRLLLTLVWEALENAGLTSSHLAQRHVGVYVGNSGIEHDNRFLFDPAGSDSFMMTGNTGALLSNRVSHVFDLHGPSLTIDTACSSSLVALDEAVHALRSGQIDTAIVAGVSLMLSPFSFVGFSAATMLSPEGKCRAFDEDAYGYVRAEGGVVLILQRDEGKRLATPRSYGRIIETGVNSDGHTVGVALPSAEFQAKLLEQVYGRAGVDPRDLAFVEAHGTGTRVGDPAEANAVGTVLGKPRSKPLPIGSAKSNVGHLEPASGMVGLLKSILALEHNLLPASLHFDNPNPDIPFDELNIAVNSQPLQLQKPNGRRFAGISNFGFGGTNVHVILADPAKRKRFDKKRAVVRPRNLLLLSAQSRDTLRHLAGRIGELLGRDGAPELDQVVNAMAWQRERLAERLVVLGGDNASVARTLQDFAHSRPAPNAVYGNAVGNRLPTALVYSGNGCQYAGMGRDAFLGNASFAERFRDIDRLFQTHADWSLEEALFADDLQSRLKSTVVAQPLLFAIQVALTGTLVEMGLRISGVLGHSVGEVAAAWACGAVSLEQAVRIIHARSHQQEMVRGHGLMVAVVLPEQEVRNEFARDPDFALLEISAVNSPRSVTVSGPTDAVQKFIAYCDRRKLVCKPLEIDYPFHSSLIDPIHEGLIEALDGLKPGKARIPFYSSVLGKAIAGPKLDANYWWDNIRRKVNFVSAVEAAGKAGCCLFMEVGAKSILRSYLRETLDGLEKAPRGFIASLTEKLGGTADGARPIDPVRLVFAQALAAGAAFDEEKVFGPDERRDIDLPLYPWQLTPYKIEPSMEAVEAFLLSEPPHPLLGQQLRRDQYIWSNDLDTGILPFLEDHKVDGKVILPGAGFAEMALAAASHWLDSQRVELRDMDILQPLYLSNEHSMQVRTRLDVESSTIEISSRKRLSDDDWVTHIKCRVSAIPGDGEDEPIGSGEAPSPHAADEPARVERLYTLARQHGLDFGPRFQRMIRCDEPQKDLIEVVLNERDPAVDALSGEAASYIMHPLDLDGSLHGINRLYETIGTGREKLAFIPIRFGTFRIYHAASAARTVRIKIRRANERSVTADFDMFDAEGRRVASLRDGRCRAAALVQRHTLERSSYSFSHLLMPLPAEAARSAAPSLEVAGAAAERASIPGDMSQLDEQHIILDALARRTAFDVLKSLADSEGGIALPLAPQTETTAPAGLEHKQRLAIVAALLEVGVQSDFARQKDSAGEENGWRVDGQCSFPPRGELIQALLREEPRWLAECTLLNRAAHLLPQLLAEPPEPEPDLLAEATKTGTTEPRPGEDTKAPATTDKPEKKPQPASGRTAFDLYSASLLEHLASASPLAELHIARLARTVEQIAGTWPADRPLRILELGVAGGGLSRRLLEIVAARHGQLVCTDSNPRSLSRLQMQLSASPCFKAVRAEKTALEREGPFDLVVSANGFHLLADAEETISEALSRLTTGGLVIATTSRPSAFHDIVFGPVTDWFGSSPLPQFPLNPMKEARDWQAFFRTHALQSIDPMPLAEGIDDAHLVIARRQGGTAGNRTSVAENELEFRARRRLLIVASTDASEAEFAEHLAAAAVEDGVEENDVGLIEAPRNDGGESNTDWSDLAKILESSGKAAVVDIVHLFSAFPEAGAPEDRLARRANNLTSLLHSLAGRAARLWLIAPGGIRATLGAGAPDPVQCGIWAYGRTASNEYGDLDIRLVDFDGTLGNADAARRLSILLAEPGDQFEAVLTPQALLSPRAVRGVPPAQSRAGAAKPIGRKLPWYKTQLATSSSGSLNSLRWEQVERRPPELDEVEIEVVAAGLNFRDVMWAQGLLPEEALEDGFAGPTLGFECSGKVVDVGRAVRDFKVGDSVVALAPSCFSSHVTVDSKAVARLPQGIDPLAAATIPVAFLTAWYALDHLARLQPGEWVLIHGAAGGVGLAALQIARWRGARVIGTAGNDEKRELLSELGADHVLDTRSLDFVDEVRLLTREQGGVDVVLNSLAGEAMERSLELMRPFGRFLELGKRDFYGNTKIGMRPFRNNISYFGIDADQLLKHQPDLSNRLFGQLMDLFANQALTPLPYRRFENHDVIDAFRLMQQSGHIGKILVSAPPAHVPSSLDPDDDFTVDPEGTHLIIGGLGGFGLETALWLADRGARSIVLTSRSGKPKPQAQDRLDELAARGVKTEVAVCDAADEKAVRELLARLRKERPIKGVMHAAMVLDDILIQNMKPGQMEKVLRPKVCGVEILDRQTRVDDLDYMVLFSSVAAMFGNPGQANYVAANAYLEGVARRRRLEGLPAIAVGWGAITDVGVLTEQKDTAESLARHTGGVEFRGRDGLELLGRLLAQPNQADIPAAITLAAMDWAFAGDILPVLKRSTYSVLARETSSSGGGRVVNVRALIEGLDELEAREKVAGLLAVEVSSILRMPVEEINVRRSLSDMGMDSLMGAELRIAAQRKLNMDFPMVSIADGTSINDIAVKVVARVLAGIDGAAARIADTKEMMAQQHLGGAADQKKVEELARKIKAE